jgi:hypothetical protein
MKRSSTTLFLECPNTVLPVPWTGIENVVSNIQSAYQSPTKEVAIASWQAFVASGDELEVIADPEPMPPQPDWDGLLSAILGGDLFSIYARLTSASFIDPAIATDALLANANNIAVASGKLDQAVQVTKVEAAVAASFQMLIASSNYRFTAEEKSLWDATVTALNFSQAMFLP